jgi:glycosyltransferase involved in cell wall biosynthesis
MRLAYLVSEYPAASHVFIEREIAALRSKGYFVLPFSVRPARSGAAGKPEQVQCLVDRHPLLYVAAIGRLVLKDPLGFLKVGALALRHRTPGLRGLVWSLFHLVEASLLAHLLRTEKITHLHSHFANSGATVAMLAAGMCDLPWSLTLHGISETDPPTGGLLPHKLRQATFVACASWFMQAQGMRVVDPRHWTKFAIVRCGVDLNRLPAPANARSAGVVRFLCVARLSPEKGYSGLLEAFARLLRRGIAAELVIVGEGPDRNRIEEQIANADLRANVRLTGALPQDATLREIAGCDAFVLPSLMEGLPVVLMEAMALERPVIASRVAGIPELFRPSDWSSLEQAMHLLASDPPLRSRLGRAGRQLVMSEFDINTAVEPLIERFRESQRCV